MSVVGVDKGGVTDAKLVLQICKTLLYTMCKLVHQPMAYFIQDAVVRNSGAGSRIIWTSFIKIGCDVQ